MVGFDVIGEHLVIAGDVNACENCQLCIHTDKPWNHVDNAMFL